MFRKFSVLAVILVILLGGCLDKPNTDGNKEPGSLLATIAVPQSKSLSDPIGIFGTLSATGQTTKEVSATPRLGLATLDFGTVSSGDWNLTVEGRELDPFTSVVYKKSTTVKVLPMKATTVDLILEPQPATVTFDVDLAPLISAGYSIGTVAVVTTSPYNDTTKSYVLTVDPTTKRASTTQTAPYGSFFIDMRVQSDQGTILWSSSTAKADFYPGHTSTVTGTSAVPTTGDGSLVVSGTVATVATAPRLTYQWSSRYLNVTTSVPEEGSSSVVLKIRLKGVAGTTKTYTKANSGTGPTINITDIPDTWAGKTMQLYGYCVSSQGYNGMVSDVIETVVP